MRSRIPQERQARITAWQDSGQSEKAYCELQGLNYATFMSLFKKSSILISDFSFALPAKGLSLSQIKNTN